MKIISAFIGIFIMIVLFGVLFNKQIKEFKDNYKKPDTTLTFKNGKWDTTIVIKQIPAWLK